MNQQTIDQVKEISAEVAIALVNATPSLGITLNKNESQECRANLMPWIDVEAEGERIFVTFDFGQIMKRPPLYGLTCSAIMAPIFKQQAAQFLKDTQGLENYQFSFGHRY